MPGLVGPHDEALLDRLAEAGGLVADLGCGDGKHSLRLAMADPSSVVVGVDAETTRLDRIIAAGRRRRLANLFFIQWSMERPLPTLTGRCTAVTVIMPWGSLLDGVLGTDEQVLTNVLALGRVTAVLDIVLNCRPWAAPATLDKKLARTPEPSREHLTTMRGQYAALGWQLGPAAWLSDREAKALGSSWASRVVSSRASRLLRLRAARC